MRFEDMTPEVQAKVRRLRGYLCEMAEEYKGVKPQVCQKCASACVYGMELLDVLGMEKPVRETDRKEGFYQDRIVNKVIHSINKQTRK